VAHKKYIFIVWLGRRREEDEKKVEDVNDLLAIFFNLPFTFSRASLVRGISILKRAEERERERESEQGGSEMMMMTMIRIVMTVFVR